jgi:hypothetical protein
MTVRVAYNLFTQHPKQEYEDFAKWVATTLNGRGIVQRAGLKKAE